MFFKSIEFILASGKAMISGYLVQDGEQHIFIKSKPKYLIRA